MEHLKTDTVEAGTSSGGARTGIQVIARAAKILRSLEGEPKGLSLGEIALKVELPRSTVQRIVSALASEQLLIAATPKSRVKLGPALIRLARATNNEIEQIARPLMEALCRDTRETIDLSVIRGKSAVFVDQVLGSQRLRAVSAIGDQFPLHCTACGKALLATLAPEKLNQFLKTQLEIFTPNTVVDPEKIRQDIERIQQTGLSYDQEEHTEGICAVAISFEDPMGRAYAVSIPVPTPRFSKNKAFFEQELLKCRDQIKLSLGLQK